MDAQFLGSLAVFLQIIDEEGFIGMDGRLPDYLLIDVGIRFCQMHSLREETVLEIILYPMVLIRKEMLHAIIPMNINGIAQEEEAVTSLLQLQESLLFLIRNLHQHLVGSIDDFFIRHIGPCQLTGCIAENASVVIIPTPSLLISFIPSL